MYTVLPFPQGGDKLFGNAAMMIGNHHLLVFSLANSQYVPGIEEHGIKVKMNYQSNVFYLGLI